MKSWTRWEDWALVVIGALAALSPIVVSTTIQSMITLIALGALVALAGLFSLAQPPQAMASEWVTLVLGVLLFIAPWVMSYSNSVGASWVSWVAGGLTIAISAIGLPSAMTGHRRVTAQH